jgi:hypothetical protein
MGEVYNLVSLHESVMHNHFFREAGSVMQRTDLRNSVHINMMAFIILQVAEILKTDTKTSVKFHQAY